MPAGAPLRPRRTMTLNPSAAAPLAKATIRSGVRWRADDPRRHGHAQRVQHLGGATAASASRSGCP
jgi:hypothetical protein